MVGQTSDQSGPARANPNLQSKVESGSANPEAGHPFWQGDGPDHQAIRGAPAANSLFAKQYSGHRVDRDRIRRRGDYMPELFLLHPASPAPSDHFDVIRDAGGFDDHRDLRPVSSLPGVFAHRSDRLQGASEG